MKKLIFQLYYLNIAAKKQNKSKQIYYIIICLENIKLRYIYNRYDDQRKKNLVKKVNHFANIFHFDLFS